MQFRIYVKKYTIINSKHISRLAQKIDESIKLKDMERFDDKAIFC